MDSINHYYFKRVEDRRAVIHRILQEIIPFSILKYRINLLSDKKYCKRSIKIGQMKSAGKSIHQVRNDLRLCLGSKS